MNLAKKLLALTLVGFLGFPINGCAVGTHNALEGGKQPDENAAYLFVSPIQEVIPLVAHAQVIIKHVDGENIIENENWLTRASEVVLEPGLHSIGIRYLYYSRVGFGSQVTKQKYWTLEIDAKPNGRYHGYARSEKGHYWAWIEDEVTGEVVAGEKQPSMW